MDVSEIIAWIVLVISWVVTIYLYENRLLRVEDENEALTDMVMDLTHPSATNETRMAAISYLKGHK
jgi:hypothetical protein